MDQANTVSDAVSEGQESIEKESVKESVLFVDDEKHILSSIRRLIRPLGFQTYFANSGAEGLEVLRNHHVDLVVSDMRMPEMDGAQFLAEVKEHWPKTVRMLLTGYADISSTIDALNNGGIYRYISKPWNDDELKEIVSDGLKIRRLERETIELQNLTRKQNEELQDLNKNLEAKVEARTNEIRQTADMLDMAYQELKESYEAFVKVFSSFVNNRESLKGHSQQIADISRKIAVSLGLDDKTVESIYFAALLHEIGKLSLSDDVLSLPEDLLSEDQLKLYQRYPLMGELALTSIGELEGAAKIVKAHCEALDGSGYPDGLSGDQIPVGARIIKAVKDVIGLQSGVILYEKMTLEQAIEELKKGARKKYDLDIARWIVKNKSELIPGSSKDQNNEIKVQLHGLKAGMVLTRNLVSTQGMLLIAKGHVLTANIINKLAKIEELANKDFYFYVVFE